MKFLLLLALPSLLWCAPQPQGGLFQSLTSAVNNFFGSSNSQPRRPQQPQRRPPPPQQQFQRPQQNFAPQQQQPQQFSQPSFQQQNSFQPPSNSFNSQPSSFNSQPSSFNSQPSSSFNSQPSSSFNSQSSSSFNSQPSSSFNSQPSSFSSQPSSSSFNSRPSFTQTQAINPAPQSSFSRPSNPAPSFQSQGVRSNSFSSSGSSSSNSFSSGSSSFSSAPFTSGSNLGNVNGCSADNRSPNFAAVDTETGRNISYVVTWKFGDTCSKFTQSEAKQFCNLMGMEPVTLNTPNKQDTFNRLIAQDAQRYMWTGGEIDHQNSRISWNNNNQRSIRFSDSLHWSNTGGAGLPQPDNRAAGESPPSPEVCLAILNNFYADGIKWHDVACHHRKPTVCEPRIQ